MLTKSTSSAYSISFGFIIWTNSGLISLSVFSRYMLKSTGLILSPWGVPMFASNFVTKALNNRRQNWKITPLLVYGMKRSAYRKASSSSFMTVTQYWVLHCLLVVGNILQCWNLKKKCLGLKYSLYNLRPLKFYCKNHLIIYLCSKFYIIFTRENIRFRALRAHLY